MSPSLGFFVVVVVQVCPWDPELHELRAECYLQVKEYLKAISDIRPTTKLRPDNTQAYYKLSTWLYAVGDAEESLKLVDIWFHLFLLCNIICDARARNPSLPRYLARGPNRREGFSSLQFFNSAGPLVSVNLP